MSAASAGIAAGWYVVGFMASMMFTLNSDRSVRAWIGGALIWPLAWVAEGALLIRAWVRWQRIEWRS